MEKSRGFSWKIKDPGNLGCLSEENKTLSQRMHPFLCSLYYYLQKSRHGNNLSSVHWQMTSLIKDMSHLGEMYSPEYCQ